MFENLIALYILALIDISMTYYYFHLVDKKNCFNFKQEKGLVAQLMFKYFKRNWYNFIIQYMITVIVIFLFFYLIPFIGNIPYYPFQIMNWYDAFYFTVIGCYIIVYWFNGSLILEARKHWDNPEYWKYKKIFEQVRYGN